MTDVVGVRFKRAGKVYYFDPAGIDLDVGDYVVVETARGQEMGQVMISPKQVLASEPPLADLDAHGCAALIGERQSAVPGPAPHRTHLRGRDTAGQQGAEFAVLREQPVGLAQTRRRADLSGFLTAAGGVQGEFTLALCRLFEDGDQANADPDRQ